MYDVTIMYSLIMTLLINDYYDRTIKEITI